MICLIKSTGYSSDISGFCSGFSWTRSMSKPGFWSVVGHEPGFSSYGYAVTDDFGNLVKVSE